MNSAYTITLAVCGVLFALVVGSFSALLPKDSAQNTKILIMVSVFSIAVSIIAFGIALYHFSNNAMYMAHFLLAMTMLVLLPASLISSAVSTITISNLRDTLAAGK